MAFRTVSPLLRNRPVLEPGPQPGPQTPTPVLKQKPSREQRILPEDVTVADVDALRPHGVLGYSNKHRPPKFLFRITANRKQDVIAIPFASYDRERQAWELPACYETLRQIVKAWPNFYSSAAAHEVATALWKEGQNEIALVRYLTDLKAGVVPYADVLGTKLQPRGYQQIAIKFLERAWEQGYGVANLDEQGLGKTCTILIALDRWMAAHPGATAIVFAPKSLLHSVWVQETVKFTSHLRPAVIEGTPKQKIEILRDGRQYDWVETYPTENGGQRTEFVKRYGNPNLFLINHEAGGRMVKKHNRSEPNPLIQAMIEFKPTFLIVDEMHRIANLGANRTRSILAVAKASKFRHGMTGTPGLPLQLFGQLRFIDPRIYPVTKDDFKSRYVKTVVLGMGQEKIIGYQRLDELERRTSQFSIRRTQADCPDIPPSTRVTIEVDMGDEQSRAYKATVDKVIAYYKENDITKANLAAQLHALRNITCGWVTSNQGIVRFKDNKKLRVLTELMDDELAPDPFRPVPKKMVVACAYREDVAIVSEALEAAGRKHVVITGDVVDTVKAKSRTEAARAFVEDPEVEVLVGITTTFGVGLNLVPRLPAIAEVMVFWSNDYSSINRDQAEKRIQRGGQTRKCRFIDLVCSGTIDETLLEANLSKRSIQEIITGDNLRKAIGAQ